LGIFGLLIAQNKQLEDVTLFTVERFFYFLLSSSVLLLVSFLAEPLLFLSPLTQQQQPPHSVYPAFMVSVQVTKHRDTICSYQVFSIACWRSNICLCEGRLVSFFFFISADEACLFGCVLDISFWHPVLFFFFFVSVSLKVSQI